MIKTILIYSGCHVRAEESHMFSDNKKGDLTVRGLDGYTLPLVMDVRITSAVPANGGPITEIEADDPNYPEKQLEKHAKEKRRKYCRSKQCLNSARIVEIVSWRAAYSS